jgi:hypothetical protein
MDKLATWAAGREKEFAVVAQQRDADGEMVDRALEVVRDFIREREVILFGGLAIDYALRLKGGSIYPEGQRPDFDFLSPQSVEDACDLADILARAGFPGVAAVRAIHVQTMRVRVDSVWVADVGHVPRDVFTAIPTFEYQGMRVAHPDFQRLDTHLAFCFPFNNPPREDVFHRWRKDAKRLSLLQAAYPILPVLQTEKAPSTKVVKATLAVPVVGPQARELRVALHGFAAYAVLRTAYDELKTTYAGRAKEVAAPRLALSFPDERSVELEVPAGDTAVFAGPEPGAAVDGLPGVVWYDPYMDACPVSARAGSACVLSTENRLLAASVYGFRGLRAEDNTPGKLARVVTPHYLLQWLLLEAHRSSDADTAAVYRAYYAHTLEILNAAEVLFAGLQEASLKESPAGTAPADVADMYAKSPFAPTVRTLGSLGVPSGPLGGPTMVNNSEAYIISMAMSAEKLKDTPPAELNLPPDFQTRFAGLPPRRYVPGKPRPPPYDYEASVLFRRSGHKRNVV